MIPDGHGQASCENCDTVLQGEYCHRCGQHAHNPLSSFAHAVEEVFESFWHLDGRVFRTLRDLLVPGRVANAYLAGHRVPYLPPLRVFVILALFAFFVAGFAIHVSAGSNDDDRFAKLTTVAAVEQQRDAELAEFEKTRAELDETPETKVGIAAIKLGQAAVRKAAERRIAELQGKPQPRAGDAEEAQTNAFVPAPVHIGGLPGFANDWLNHKLAQGNRNIVELQRDPNAFVHELVHSVPTALFVLVPVFALLLKLFYIRSRRGYLEHLVVALYSHASLCLGLLAIFVLQIIAGKAPVVSGLLGWLQALIWLWMAVYLWWTQYRVYAQSVLKTTVKYVLLGSIYFWMVAFASLAVLVGNLVRG